MTRALLYKALINAIALQCMRVCRRRIVITPCVIDSGGENKLLGNNTRLDIAAARLFINIWQLYSSRSRGELPLPHVTRAIQNNVRRPLPAAVVPTLMYQIRHTVKALRRVTQIRFWNA